MEDLSEKSLSRTFMTRFIGPEVIYYSALRRQRQHHNYRYLGE